MNRDDIIRIAQEVSGVEFPASMDGVKIGMSIEHLERFANFVSAEWQEKCNTYIQLHDAVVKDSDRLYAKLKEKNNG